MAVPSLHDLTLPLLKLAARREVDVAQAVPILAQEFKLTEAERSEMVSSGITTRFENRIRWAKVELGMAALIEKTQGRLFAATEAGKELLSTDPGRIDRRLLMKISRYREAIERSQTKSRERREQQQETVADERDAAPPEERLDSVVQDVTAALQADLLDRLARSSPTFFEHVVLKMLLAMGYGKSRPDAGRHLGKAGDGGIDGVISEDALGLDRIYVQAKRYDPKLGSVGRPEIQAFVGSLVGHGASKGVFVTTASFSEVARQYAYAVPQRIILIDGAELTRLMIQYNVGVRTTREVSLKAADENFFDE